MTDLKPNDFRFVLLTMMKDEAPYILDWISYHVSIGFTHFVILTNDCSDGTDKICRNLAKLGFVTHINNKAPYPKGIQKTGWQRASRWTPVKEAEWMMVLDVDEYLNLNIGQGNLDELLKQLDERAVAVSFPWQIFGNDDVEKLEDRPVVEQFTRSAHPLQAKPYQIRGMKTLYRKRFFEKIGTHMPQEPRMGPIAGRHWVNADGVPIDTNFERPVWCVWNNGYGFGGALGRVNHYALRSKEAFFIKYMRGFANRTSRGVRSESKPIDYWQMFDWNIFPATDILTRYDRAQEIKQILTSENKIQRLHNQGFEWHQNRARELIHSDRENRQNFDQIFEIKAKKSLDPSDPVLMADSGSHFLFDANRFKNWSKNSIIKPIFIDEYYQRFAALES